TQPTSVSRFVPYTTLFRSLIHIGIDTVNLKGEGFKVLVEQGSKVKKGDDLIRFDLETINNAGYDDDVIIVVTNSDFYKKFEIERSEEHTSELQSRFDLVCR